MEVDVLEFAEDDIEEGITFYERQSAGLGDYFFDSISADIDSLMLYGGIHRKVYGLHRLLAEKFPFAIYYELAGEVVRVWAVIDCRSRPAWIRKTITNRLTKR